MSDFGTTSTDNVTEITNVLALSAAIEAAHAGVAGKNFAVIASKIRNHAATTKTAVDAISANVSFLIKTIGGLALGMDSVKKSRSGKTDDSKSCHGQ